MCLFGSKSVAVTAWVYHLTVSAFAALTVDIHFKVQFLIGLVSNEVGSIFAAVTMEVTMEAYVLMSVVLSAAAARGPNGMADPR